MVDFIKGCTDVNLRKYSISAHSRMHFAVYETHTKVYHRYPDFPISKLGNWKHTTVFHKSPETNRHQTLKHFRPHWCFGNWSVFFQLNRMSPFGILVGFACLQQAGKLFDKEKAETLHSRSGGQISSSLQKTRKHPMGQCHHTESLMGLIYAYHSKNKPSYFASGSWTHAWCFICCTAFFCFRT